LQLFGLVNTLLANSRLTAEKDLSIQRYSVIPLSPNSGLIGWVPNCDTLHHLIREYREPRKACYLLFNPPKIFLLFMNHGWLQQGMCFSVFAPPPPQVLEEQKNASLSE
jgi:phosphatidylinositol kinase/protein kinase (PI-3  family)